MKPHTKINFLWLALFACWCCYGVNTELPVREKVERVGWTAPLVLFGLVYTSMWMGYLAGKENAE